MEESRVIALVYAFFIGILLAVFVGFGIATFYSAPEQPEFPQLSERVEPFEQDDTEISAYDKEYDIYSKELQSYHRNVSIISLIAAVVLVSAGLLLAQKLTILADGILLGGLLTLIYSIGRSFASEDPAYSFITITISLIITFVLGYKKFVQTAKPKQN